MLCTLLPYSWMVERADVHRTAQAAVASEPFYATHRFSCLLNINISVSSSACTSLLKASLLYRAVLSSLTVRTLDCGAHSSLPSLYLLVT